MCSATQLRISDPFNGGGSWHAGQVEESDPIANTDQATSVPSPPLVLESVSVRFGNKLALDNISLELLAGSSLALVGANGSGKSTLLDVVSGLRTVSSGVRRLDASVTPTFAYVLQHNATQRWLPLTAGEVVTMGRFGSPSGKPHRWLGPRRLSDADHAAIRRAAERLDIVDILDQPLSVLSGGQRQRVLVAQAIAQQPTILLLDEPITGLNIPSQERILELMSEETSAGTSVVVSTHHLDEARHCSRVMLLATEVVAVGPPEKVLVPSLLRKTFGDKVLGDHAGHDHADDFLMFDTHGHPEAHDHH